jgi:hypothetical protein
MLSLPAITADSNACRHPTIEVINPSPLVGLFWFRPSIKCLIGVPLVHSRSLLQVIRNSKKRRQYCDQMTPLRDVGATSASTAPRLPFGQIAAGCSETWWTHREGTGLARLPPQKS